MLAEHRILRQVIFAAYHVAHFPGAEGPGWQHWARENGWQLWPR